MTLHIPHTRKTSEWILHWFCVLLAGIIFAYTLSPDSLSSTAHRLINYALFITLTSYLLLPPARNLSQLLANSLAPIVSLYILSQLFITQTVSLKIFLPLSVMTFIFSLLLCSLKQLNVVIYGKSSISHKLVYLLTVIVILLPVWLGPWVDVYQPSIKMINSIIFATPLTHFSVAVQYDYLRSLWFYQNTPFGSLPFTYPGLMAITFNYLLIICCLQIILWRVTRHIKNSALKEKVQT